MPSAVIFLPLMGMESHAVPEAGHDRAHFVSTSACPCTDVASWAVGVPLTDTALPQALPHL